MKKGVCDEVWDLRLIREGVWGGCIESKILEKSDNIMKFFFLEILIY